jgi:two-component system, NtrC family, sensor kinase
MECPRCQQDNPTEQKFFGQCGTRLAGAAGASPYGDLKDENEGLRRSLTEALEQQTATEEILSVISRSPTDLQPVFDTIARHAVRVCDSTDAVVALVDGGESVIRAHYGDQGVPTVGQRRPIIPGLVLGRALLEARSVQVEDLTSTDDFPEGRDLALRMGHRTIMAVPLLHDGVAIGGILMRRNEVKPFTDKQVALLQTFADQALIAIENVRLFKELEARNAALSESLEQQTATREILRVISRSPTDATPVFDVIVEHACRLCDAVFANAIRFDGELMHNMAQHGFSPDAQEMVRRFFPMRPTRASMSGRAILSGTVVYTEDASTDGELIASRELSNLMGFGLRSPCRC